jgi:hypothetical protein
VPESFFVMIATPFHRSSPAISSGTSCHEVEPTPMP